MRNEAPMESFVPLKDDPRIERRKESTDVGVVPLMLNFAECDGRTSYPLFTAFWGIAT